MDIKKVLEGLGFTEKEIKVYLVVLKAGKITPAAAAKAAKIRRPNIYNVASSLVSKGVISEDFADKALNLVALPPAGLKASIERARVEIQKKEELVDAAVAHLALLASEKSYPVPKLRFVEEGELRNFLFQNASKWHKSVMQTDGVWWGFQDDSFVEQYQDWIEWTVKKSDVKKYKVNLFSNTSPIELKMRGKISIRNIRFLENTQFTATTWVVGDYVVMISSRKAPFYLTEVHDALMAENMREVFRRLWAV
jgi:hypothetical protein